MVARAKLNPSRDASERGAPRIGCRLTPGGRRRLRSSQAAARCATGGPRCLSDSGAIYRKEVREAAARGAEVWFVSSQDCRRPTPEGLRRLHCVSIAIPLPLPASVFAVLLLPRFMTAGAR